MKFLKGTAKYKADVDGELTLLDQQIEIVNLDSINGAAVTTNKKFEECLKYDITRTVVNILSNATIKYNGASTAFCISLQKFLPEIYFNIYKFGFTFVILSNKKSILGTTQKNQKGAYKIVDQSWEISGITQKSAADKALDLYGVVADTMYGVIAERGMLGMFSPQKDTIIKPSQADKFYKAWNNLFGGVSKKRKVGLFEIPMTYSGVNLPIKDMELIANKKDATATTARIFGIQEDMILSGSTFDNKENAIIQTYTDYKGLIYNYINQIENQIISLSINTEAYDVTFPGVPQLNQTKISTNG